MRFLIASGVLMQVLSDTGGIASTNCFVIADEVAKQAVLFDAPDHTVEPLLEEVARRGWDLVGLWLTHGHFDHVADHAIVREKFPKAQVLIHRLDEEKLKNPNSRTFVLPFVIPPGKSDRVLEDGDELRLGSMTARVIHTPGHSPGHVCYYFAEQNLLVSGDLIIMGAIGRTDLPDCDPAAMDESLRKIMRLPDETVLLPGHGDMSSIRDERANNEYVQMALRGG
jgi:hydroxyacylglutathione hydrolase